jgi:hypothetical protein
VVENFLLLTAFQRFCVVANMKLFEFKKIIVKPKTYHLKPKILSFPSVFFATAAQQVNWAVTFQSLKNYFDLNNLKSATKWLNN